jgi:hypothetical protein
MWVATCMPVIHIFSPLISQPSLRVSRHGAGFHVVASEPWLGSVRPKAGDELAGKPPRMNSSSRVPKSRNISDEREVADDRVLVLQVVVQAEALGGEMLADDRHPQVGAVLAAIFFRQPISASGRPCRPLLGFAQQLLPIRGAAGLHSRNRCAPIRGGDRRSARCRPAPAAA